MTIRHFRQEGSGLKTCRIPHTDLEVSRIACGCMNLSRAWDDTAITATEISATLKVVETALEQGITLFDHADIYARGKSEQLFGEALRQIPELRGRIVLQSKCGIRVAGDPETNSPARYDFSRGHIVRSVEGTLKRLDTDHLDILLLHRPDALMEPAEVARAFDQLQVAAGAAFGATTIMRRRFAVAEHLEQPLVGKVNGPAAQPASSDGLLSTTRGTGAGEPWILPRNGIRSRSVAWQAQLLADDDFEGLVCNSQWWPGMRKRRGRARSDPARGC